MNTLPVVAVLGLGAMGHAFAANLVTKGFIVRGWNRTRQRGEDLAAAGMTLCDTPRKAVSGARVIIVMLPDDAAATEVIHGPDGVLELLDNQAIIAQMGTIGSAATERLSRMVAQVRPDVVFLDAPVSGTKTPAENAQIMVLASGDRQRAAAIEPVFSAIAKATKWFGPAGGGTRMKLVVNAWLIAMMQGMSESLQLAQQLGFTPDDFWDVLEGGPLAAPYVKNKLEMIKADNYAPQMQLIWALKDANLALDAAGSGHMPVLRTTADLWQCAVDAGLGEEDIAVVYRYLRDHH
ncbi:NAD(P)-dependent oxidoreductase [Acerihabitans sp. TG2]|uniref:NAD(P)-dependent oxidoreductase n=1 Tax=Acerihabitans sp. TG2 TaxID=3096008 RepID=UPI002B226F42|nr:NAD(P)-dependent oxidoreductase [Acerihabitans sp. TG2]MEA9393445.1 NAD(P)-dependent oxidoreductase [Acerihabitans sp. TG2]